jgi:predicted nuclease of predicted toxin-antitoxin system
MSKPKFIVDENISPMIRDLLRDHGFEAYHVNDMKVAENQKIPDDHLRKLALYKGYVVITRDDDFVKSYVDRKVPDKMIYVFDLDCKAQLIKRFNETLDTLQQWLTTYDFIELNPAEIRTPFDTFDV